MAKIREVYEAARAKLNSDIPVAALRLLMVESNNLKNYAELDHSLEKEQQNEAVFWHQFESLNKGVPVQYVTNNANFLGDDFHVDSPVLIPRPETEELVEQVYRDLLLNYRDEPFSLVDVGTGSGVIAISLAKRFEEATIYATDIDYDALKVARFNAMRHEVNVKFFIGDMLKPLIDNNIKVDILVSNPPYVAKLEEVDEKVYNYEPHLALEAEDGIEYYKKILKDIDKIFDDKIKLFFEIGSDQEERLTEIIEQLKYEKKYYFSRDLQGNIRYLFLELTK